MVGGGVGLVGAVSVVLLGWAAVGACWVGGCGAGGLVALGVLVGCAGPGRGSDEQGQVAQLL